MNIIELLKMNFRIYDRVRFFWVVPYLLLIAIVLLVWINSFIYKLPFLSWETIIYILSNRKKHWAPDIVLVSMSIVAYLYVTVVLFWIIKYIYKAIQSPKSWKLNRDLDFKCFNNLDIQGRVINDKKSLKFTSSAAGILINEKFWKNFKAVFDLYFDGLKESQEIERGKLFISKNNYAGFIFRAQDLNNYFMISFGIKDGFVIITPHLKLNGIWEVFYSDYYKSTLNGLENAKLKFDISVLDTKMDLKVYRKDVEDKILYEYTWLLPNKFKGNYEDDNTQKTQQIEGQQSESVFGASNNIPFRMDYGMIGFRAYGDEHFVVEDLVITKQ